MNSPTAAALLLALLSPTPRAADLKVPADYSSIPLALAAAVPGDRVLVSPGTYTGALSVTTASVTLEGDGGPEFVTLTANNGAPVVTFAPAAVGSTLRGFSITNPFNVGVLNEADGVTIEANRIVCCDNPTDGGGVLDTGGALIRDNLIRDCISLGSGAGIMARRGSTIVGNHIARNIAEGIGGGICVFDMNISAPLTVTITGNHIERNHADSGGGLAAFFTPFDARNNFIARNGTAAITVGPTARSGGGVFQRGAGFPQTISTLSGNVIVRNGSSSGYDTLQGGGLFVSGGTVDATNNTFWGNACVGATVGSAGGGVFVDGASTVNLSNSIVWENDADTSDNLHVVGTLNPLDNSVEGVDPDPLLADPSFRDVHLQAGSPAIGAGSPMATAVPVLDIDGDPMPSPPPIGADTRVEGIALHGGPPYSPLPAEIVLHATGDPGDSVLFYIGLVHLPGPPGSWQLGTPYSVFGPVLPLGTGGTTTLPFPVGPQPFFGPTYFQALIGTAGNTTASNVVELLLEETGAPSCP